MGSGRLVRRAVFWKRGDIEKFGLTCCRRSEAFVNLPEYEKAVQDDESAKDFVPPGKRVHNYVTRGRTYEIWAGSLADPEVRRLLDRAQIFVSLFIEAGTPLDTEDPEWSLERWTVYFVYDIINFPKDILQKLTRLADMRR